MSDKIEILDADKNEVIVKTKRPRYSNVNTRTPKAILDKRQQNSLREEPLTKKLIDPKAVYKLALIDCTYSEIASICECSQDWLRENFGSWINKGWEDGKASIRRQLHKSAESGNIQAQIWLSKQRVGYVDRSEVKSDTTLTINVAE